MNWKKILLHILVILGGVAGTVESASVQGKGLDIGTLTPLIVSGVVNAIVKSPKEGEDKPTNASRF